MTPDEEAFERRKLCYEQNFEQLRSLNEQMNRVPPVSITITGGLWYGASLAANVNPVTKFGLLILAAICNLALILACIRIRDVMQSYFEKIRRFDPDWYADGRPDKPFLGNLGAYSMIMVYSALLFTVAGLSLFGAIEFYWPFAVGRQWAWLLLFIAVWTFILVPRVRALS